MTREEARRAVRQGAYTALAVAALTVLIVVVGSALGGMPGVDPTLFDPWSLLDAAVMALLAIGMFRMSRAAACAAFVLYVVARVATMLDTGSVGNVVLPILIVGMLGRAVYASFVFQRIEAAENPDRRVASAWMYWVGIPFAIVFVFLVGLGLADMGGLIPANEVRAGDQLHGSVRQELLDAGILGDDEQIAYFYSEDLFSELAAGNVATDRRVIRYYLDADGNLMIHALPHDEIESIELLEQGSALMDSVYAVEPRDTTAGFEILLSVEEDGDRAFVDFVRSKLATPSS